MTEPADDEDATAGDVPRAGPTNSLLDVAGLRVGHATRRDANWLTGTTVVLAPVDGVTAGVDVRGGGPGTRETDLLDPRNLIERVHAIVLSGGSAFGLGTAQGVMQALLEDGIGLPVGGHGEVVPIVPAAVIYDLGRGGEFRHWPDAALGRAAYDAANQDAPAGLAQGVVGAGTGALAGGLKGGVGGASVVLTGGVVVAALVVVNAVGSVVDPQTGELYAARYLLPDEHANLGVPTPLAPGDAARRATDLPTLGATKTGLATTIGVIATDATLTKSQCAKLAGVGHDGLARAIRPAHSMVDGDTLFAVSTADRAAPDVPGLNAVLAAGADVVTRAIAGAVLSATAVATAAGSWRSYRDAISTGLSVRSGEG